MSSSHDGSGPTLTGLHLYPVKSCRGSSLSEAAVGRTGMEDDRRWMVVDRDGRFLTQAEQPRMSLVRPRLEEGRLRLDAPDVDPLILPRLPDPTPGGESGRIRVQVWDDECDAVDEGEEAARWLRAFLGVDCRLVRQAVDDRRQVDPDYALGPNDTVSFADAFPFLLTSEASLADLNGRLERPLPMERFRPNLVVGGTGAFEEDEWRTIRIGGIVFSVVKPCARCSITTVDPDTGRMGKEPLRTLALYRRGKKGGVEFGRNLVHHGPGALRVGAEVEILDRV